MKKLALLIGLFLASFGSANANCVQAHTFTTGEVLTASVLNANPAAEVQCINSINNSNVGPLGIYASQIIPTTVAQAAFGGTLTYKFPASINANGYNTSTGTVELNSDGTNVFIHSQLAGGFFYFANANGTINSYLRNDGYFFPGNGSTFIGPGGSQFSGFSSFLNDLSVSGAFTVGGLITANGGISAVGSTIGGIQLLSGVITAGAVNASGNITAGNIFSNQPLYIDSQGGAFNPSGSQVELVSNAGALIVASGSNSGMTVANSVNNAFEPVAASAFNVGSDIKWKRDVAPLPTGMATIMALKPVDFFWRSNGKFDEGFIAQDVQGVLPLAVTQAQQGLTVNYDPIVANLVAAVQTQQQEIRMLRARLDRLEQEKK